MLYDVITGIAILNIISLILTVLLVISERLFLDYGECKIDINDGTRIVVVKGGQSLLRSLSEHKIFLPSGCGGRGSCGTCKCKVTAGGGQVLPTELPYLNMEELKSNVRLSCQVRVKKDIKIIIPEELLLVKEFIGKVVKKVKLTHDILGLRIILPANETIKFKAGQFVNLVSPPYGNVSEPTSRAYSISSPPSDDRHVELVIRRVPNGIVTTYIFDYLKEGDDVKIIGPYGEFYLRDSNREILFIAGGSGLAPIRSIILDMLDKKITHRKATFFFGAVNKQDLFYVEEFKKIESENSWFRYIPALSGKEQNHEYEKGLITDVVAKYYDKFDNHEAYLCGSPGMINACVQVLKSKGMPESLIYYDKFS